MATRSEDLYLSIPNASPIFSKLAISSQFKVSLNLVSSTITGSNVALYQHLTNCGIFQDSSSTYQKYDFLCSSASLPGSNFNISEELGSRQGMTERFATRRIYNEFDLTFYIDDDYNVLRMLEEWMNFINPVYNESNGRYDGSPSSQLGAYQERNTYSRFRYPDDYRRKLSITKFERDFLENPNDRNNTFKNMPLLTYNFIDTFPVNINAVPLSYDGSTFLQVTVVFTYLRHTIEKHGNAQQSVREKLVNNSLTQVNPLRPKIIGNEIAPSSGSSVPTPPVGYVSGKPYFGPTHPHDITDRFLSSDIRIENDDLFLMTGDIDTYQLSESERTDFPGIYNGGLVRVQVVPSGALSITDTEKNNGFEMPNGEDYLRFGNRKGERYVVLKKIDARNIVKFRIHAKVGTGLRSQGGNGGHRPDNVGSEDIRLQYWVGDDPGSHSGLENIPFDQNFGDPILTEIGTVIPILSLDSSNPVNTPPQEGDYNDGSLKVFEIDIPEGARKENVFFRVIQPNVSTFGRDNYGFLKFEFVDAVPKSSIRIDNHTKETGDVVTYFGDVSIGGLENETRYYTIKVDDNLVQLATSLSNANAGIAITFTSKGSGNHQLYDRTIRMAGEAHAPFPHAIVYDTLQESISESSTTGVITQTNPKTETEATAGEGTTQTTSTTETSGGGTTTTETTTTTTTTDSSGSTSSTTSSSTSSSSSSSSSDSSSGSSGSSYYSGGGYYGGY